MRLLATMGLAAFGLVWIVVTTIALDLMTDWNETFKMLVSLLVGAAAAVALTWVVAP